MNTAYAEVGERIANSQLINNLKDFLCRFRSGDFMKGAKRGNIREGVMRNKAEDDDLSIMWDYHGSHQGFGTEVVSYVGVPIWAMSFHKTISYPVTLPAVLGGGDKSKEELFFNEAELFLLEQLRDTNQQVPVRGYPTIETRKPASFRGGSFSYNNKIETPNRYNPNITEFTGIERVVFHQDKSQDFAKAEISVFSTRYQGGLIVPLSSEIF